MGYFTLIKSGAVTVHFRVGTSWLAMGLGFAKPGGLEVWVGRDFCGGWKIRTEPHFYPAN